MEEIDTFEMIESLRNRPVIDNELIKANLLAGQCSELRKIAKALRQIERNLRK